MSDQLCLRWNRRRNAWRPAGELFNPAHHAVVEIDEADAKAFVCKHHYSGSYPSARFRAGLMRRDGSGWKLAGVAVYSVPASERVFPKWTGGSNADSVDLGRLVMLDEVEGNAESWFVSRANGLLHAAKPEIVHLTSFSDPVPRTDLDGNVVKVGHFGCIYQALSMRMVGRTNPKTMYLTPDGTEISRRPIVKIQQDDVGAGYAIRMLEDSGAPMRRMGESGRDYVKRVMESGVIRRVRHHGNYAYVAALGSKSTKRAARRQHKPALAYPKAA